MDPPRAGTLWSMRRGTIDWDRVALILGARPSDDIITCPACRAQGSVPYIAEHVLATHPESKNGKQLAKLVLGSDGRRSA